MRAAVLALLLAGCGSPAAESALAALRAGDLAAAEAASADAPPAWRAFVRGNVAFARSERAEAAARAPDAPRLLMERALADAEDAVAHWRVAAASRDDWPAARRNVERGLLRLRRLRERKRDGAGRPEQGGPPGGPRPPAPGPPEETPGDADADPEVERGALPPEQVRALLDRLREKEAEKRRVREERRAAASADVERDW